MSKWRDPGDMEKMGQRFIESEHSVFVGTLGGVMYALDAATAAKINSTKAAGGRIVAVGSTSTPAPWARWSAGTPSARAATAPGRAQSGPSP